MKRNSPPPSLHQQIRNLNQKGKDRRSSRAHPTTRTTRTSMEPHNNTQPHTTREDTGKTRKGPRETAGNVSGMASGLPQTSPSATLSTAITTLTSNAIPPLTHSSHTYFDGSLNRPHGPHFAPVEDRLYGLAPLGYTQAPSAGRPRAEAPPTLTFPHLP